MKSNYGLAKNNMDKKVRRVDRKIDDKEALVILTKGEYGILSMSTPDYEGYGIPLNYVFDRNKIYFHCAVDGKKLDYLRSNNKVSFCVVGHTQIMPSKFGTLYESCIVSGLLSEVDGDEKRNALMLIIEKYSNDFVEEGKEYIKKLYDKTKVLRLSIKSITGKSRKQ